MQCNVLERRVRWNRWTVPVSVKAWKQPRYRTRCQHWTKPSVVSCWPHSCACPHLCTWLAVDCSLCYSEITQQRAAYCRSYTHLPRTTTTTLDVHTWTPTVCCSSSLPTTTLQLVWSASRLLGKVVYCDNRKSPKLLSRVAVSQTGRTLKGVHRGLEIARHTRSWWACSHACRCVQVLFHLATYASQVNREHPILTMYGAWAPAVVLIPLTDTSRECFQIYCMILHAGKSVW